jgi:GTP-binding protein
VAEWERRLGGEVPVIVTSSATGAGLDQLAGELSRLVTPRGASEEDGASDQTGAGTLPSTSTAGAGAEQDLAEYMVFRPAVGKGFEVEQTGAGSFAVRGKGIERLLQRYDIENEDAMAYLEERLRRIGVLGALQAEGFQPGDELEVGGVTFELDPDAPA